MYEEVGARSGRFKQIGSFGSLFGKPVRILYQGGVHFDALELDPERSAVMEYSSYYTPPVDVMGRRGEHHFLIRDRLKCARVAVRLGYHCARGSSAPGVAVRQG